MLATSKEELNAAPEFKTAAQQESDAAKAAAPDTSMPAADPMTPPAAVASLIGIDGELEIYEVTVETIGYFSSKLGDFVNPRIPPQPGDAVFLTSSDTLATMLSPRRMEQTGSAHVGSLLTREPGEVPVVLTTHETEEARMQRALSRIAKLKAVAEAPCLIRIESF